MAITNPKAGQIKDLSQLPLILFAGKAVLTFESIASGDHRTFKITELKKALYSVHVRKGPTYHIIGKIDNMTFFPVQDVLLRPEVNIFSWIYKNLIHKDLLESRIRVYHQGTCVRCGRELTNPESIASGVGPECLKLLTS